MGIHPCKCFKTKEIHNIFLREINAQATFLKKDNFVTILEKYQVHLDKIIKIQAFYRAFFIRQKFRDVVKKIHRNKKWGTRKMKKLKNLPDFVRDIE